MLKSFYYDKHSLKMNLECLKRGLMGEGFILLTRGYGLMGVYHPLFDKLKNVLLLLI